MALQRVGPSLGHRDLYLYTERDSGAQALYVRLRWKVIETGRYDGMAVTLMRASLNARDPASA